MALGVDGVRIGMWTSPDAVTGCTVVLPPDGTVGAIAVRGVAPGTREAAVLGPASKVTVCHGIVLSGGSAYGLATADGVMRWLEQHGTGYATADWIVPIVGAAILLDASVRSPQLRPGATAGWAACEASSEDDPPEGGVGVGAGCTVAKVAGIEHAWRSGQGIAVRRAAGVTVGVIVANNAVGEVVDDDGSWVVRARVADDAPRYPTDAATRPGQPPGAAAVGLQPPPEAAASGGDPPPGSAASGPSASTVLGCIVTDARLTKQQAHRVADLGHGGLARALRPAHTEFDGDALFCLATGQVDATVDLVAHLAVEAVADALRRGPRAATGHSELPGLADR